MSLPKNGTEARHRKEREDWEGIEKVRGSS
jgi:hypothetical protein